MRCLQKGHWIVFLRVYDSMVTEWQKLREEYYPKKVNLVFVLESPPENHGYVYDPAGRTSEVLFRAFMKLLGITPQTKEEGLRVMQKKGWLLTNPIYIPVNKLPDREADRLILENYPNFLTDLDVLIKGNKRTPMILVKANIFRLLNKKLVDDGYRVLNGTTMIPFPLHYHADRFHKACTKLMKNL